MTTERPDVSAISVTYRSAGWIEGALASAAAGATEAGLTIELIVVDNASDDGSADLVEAAFPSARVLRNSTNVGFGAANNQAFELARGRWWLLLNPDARVEPGALRTLVGTLEPEDALAVVAPSVRTPGTFGAENAGMLPGIRSLLGHFLFLNRLPGTDRAGAWRGWMLRPQGPTGGRGEVEWASGAVLLARPEAVRSIGGFDASIFMYGEDIDLCARLLDAGWRIGLQPAARGSHAIGVSAPETSTRWVDGLDAYLARRGAPRWRRAICLLVVSLGLAIRGIDLGSRSTDPAAVVHRRRMRRGSKRALALTLGARRVSDPGPRGWPSAS